MKVQNEIKNFLKENCEIISKIDTKQITKTIKLIKSYKKKKGRIFFCGNGGGAGDQRDGFD